MAGFTWNDLTRLTAAGGKLAIAADSTGYPIAPQQSLLATVVYALNPTQTAAPGGGKGGNCGDNQQH